jgi:hypothetical protein
MKNAIKLGLSMIMVAAWGTILASAPSSNPMKQVASHKQAPLEDLPVILRLLKVPLQKRQVDKADMWRKIDQLLTFHRHKYWLWLDLAKRGKSEDLNVTVVPSYNTRAWAEKNLRLIFDQEYGKRHAAFDATFKPYVVAGYSESLAKGKSKLIMAGVADSGRAWAIVNALKKT